MKIYQIRSDHQRGFTYASGYGELATTIPFIGGEALERRREFWKINALPPGLVIESSGSKWPDFILCGLGPARTLVSERAAKTLINLTHGIISKTEFPVAKINNKKLCHITPPLYLAVQWHGGIEVDWHATGVEHDAKGSPILIPGKLPKLVAKLSTWNEEDIFSWTNWGNTRLTMLCTDRVVELAGKEKWTNVQFEPVPTT